jgi:hypothetical protein
MAKNRPKFDENWRDVNWKAAIFRTSTHGLFSSGHFSQRKKNLSLKTISIHADGQTTSHNFDENLVR